MQGVVLAPLQYVNPDRLVMVWENNPRFPRTWVSYPNFRDWQRSARSFQQMAAFSEQGVDFAGPGTPEHLNGKEISSGFFSTLGTELTLGREFSPEEDRSGGTPVVIISNRLWRNRFDGSPEVLGKSLTLEGVDYTIVGVTALGFRLEDDADVYTPLGQSDPLILNDRAAHNGIYPLARLAPGVTLAQAQAEITTIQNGLDHLYPDANRDLGIYIEPLKQFVVGDAGKMLLLLFGAVGFVLLIACANVANLREGLPNILAASSRSIRQNRPSRIQFRILRKSGVVDAARLLMNVRCGCSLPLVWRQDPPTGRISQHYHRLPRAIPCRTGGAPCSSLDTGRNSYLLY